MTDAADAVKTIDERLGRIVALMAASEVYRTHTVADLDRVVLPCLALGQAWVTPASFGTWAWLSAEAETGFAASGCATARSFTSTWAGGGRGERRSRSPVARTGNRPPATVTRRKQMFDLIGAVVSGGATGIIGSIVVAETAGAALVASYRHDRAAAPATPWVADVKSMVRPALTFALIILTAAIYFALDDGADGAAELRAYVVNTIVYTTSAAVLWWFGDRAREMRR